MQPHPNPDVYERLISTEMEKRALLEAFDQLRPRVNEITLDMISEDCRDVSLPLLDQHGIDESKLTADQLSWRRNGFLIKEGFIPDKLIKAYSKVRERVQNPKGWGCPVPYMHHPEIRDICLYAPLLDLMKSLIGEDMGLHLNLTGWVTTGRHWHQDDYLNPPYVNSWYCAAWIALDDIHPDCGPFELVVGSNWWPLTRSHKVKMWMDPRDRDRTDWPNVSEGMVSDILDAEVKKRGAEVKQFVAKKGDLLLWHGRLLHRGSIARQPGMIRKSLIAHYSGINHRPDLPDLAYHNRRPYFHIPLPIDA
jgi:hypothetical protein